MAKPTQVHRHNHVCKDAVAMWEKFGVGKIGELGKKKDIRQLFTCQLLLYNQFCLYMQLICQYFTSIGSDYSYIAHSPMFYPTKLFPRMIAIHFKA